MSSSDFHFNLVLQQRHAELVQEAAERRLARSLKVPAAHQVAAWWQRAVARLGQRPAARPRPARLQSVQP